MASENDPNLDEMSWVTQVVQDSFSFRWTIKDIKNFSELQTGKLESPVFIGGPLTKHSWQLVASITPKKNEEYRYELGVYLMLKKMDMKSKTDAVNAKFEVTVLENREHNHLVKSWGRGRFSVGSVHGGLILNWDDIVRRTVDGELRLHCKVWLEGEHVHHLERGFQMDDDGFILSERQVLTPNDFKRLWETSEGSDVTIKTPTETFEAHKIILSCRSPVFKTMFTTNMSESTSNVIDIPDFGADIVKGMLSFVYGQRISMTVENTLDFLRIAEKYDLQELKQLAECKFLHDYLKVENSIDALLVADMYNAPHLKTKVMEYFKSNRTAIMETETFENLMETNRKLFMDICRL